MKPLQLTHLVSIQLATPGFYLRRLATFRVSYNGIIYITLLNTITTFKDYARLRNNYAIQHFYYVIAIYCFVCVSIIITIATNLPYLFISLLLTRCHHLIPMSVTQCIHWNVSILLKSVAYPVNHNAELFEWRVFRAITFHLLFRAMLARNYLS